MPRVCNWENSPTGIYLLYLRAQRRAICEFPVETQRELAALAWARLSPAQRDWCHSVSREVRRCRDPAATLYGVRLVLESLARTHAVADE